MKCPIDQSELVMTDRNGVEIDYCPQCRGVWLDRGELDKIIDRSESASPTAPPPQQYREERRPQYDDRRDHHYDDRSHHKKKRKESFLGDMFDF